MTKIRQKDSDPHQKGASPDTDQPDQGGAKDATGALTAFDGGRCKKRET